MTETDIPSSGLTKREMFAMAAMQGLLASKSFDCSKFETGNEWYESVAFHALDHADLLLSELAQVSK
jgi:hypothetical protein